MSNAHWLKKNQIHIRHLFEKLKKSFLKTDKMPLHALILKLLTFSFYVSGFYNFLGNIPILKNAENIAFIERIFEKMTLSFYGH